MATYLRKFHQHDYLCIDVDG